MVQTQNKMFDDFARLATSAAGTLHGMKAEIEGMVRQQAERMAAELNLVSREEFEAVKEMAIAARTENDRLRQRITTLEEALAAKSKAAKPSGKEAGRGANRPSLL